MKIITIVGARPQFIKASMISRVFRSHNQTSSPKIEEIIIHTGQHFDKNMSEIFFSELDIPKPNYNLGIHSLSHGAMTGRQLEQIEKVLIKEKPDWVLVFGDTNSTLAGALAATKLNFKVAHVEAGLRSFNRNMPEEINRILTDHVSDILFAPTETAYNNLINEGINKEKIRIVGDVMFDASLHFALIAERTSNIINELNLRPNEYILATIHRAENTDNPENLKNIFKALADAPLQVVIPLHPRTKTKLDESKIIISGQIKTVEPVSYLDMIMLEKKSFLIVTDSGGIQKEAFFYKKPCITLREETEWIELVNCGVNLLVGSNSLKISDSFNSFPPLKFNQTFYGSGDASTNIVKQLTNL
jgi:UDP-GlcNAc3NAcA epimerase